MWAVAFFGLGPWNEYKAQSYLNFGIHRTLPPKCRCHVTSFLLKLPYHDFHARLHCTLELWTNKPFLLSMVSLAKVCLHSNRKVTQTPDTPQEKASVRVHTAGILVVL